VVLMKDTFRMKTILLKRICPKWYYWTKNYPYYH